jgi:nucleoside-diphosphate-sugar epimerase
MNTTERELDGRTLLVTGGTGFVGSAFVRHAVAQGADVVVLARASSDHWRLAPVVGRYHRIEAPLESLDGREIVVPRPPDAVVHFAAAGVDQTFDDVDTIVAANVTGTLHALQAALRVGARRFILVGSSAEYGPGVHLDEDRALHPTSEYGASRAAASLIGRAFGLRRGLDVVVVRPFAVYGPFESPYRLVPYCILQGLRGEPIRISSGVQTRDYVHVDDVARGVAAACVAADAAGGTFNLCTGRETSVLAAAETIARLTGGLSTVEAGMRESLPGEMWRTTGSPDRSRERLGWSARLGLEEGLDATIAWFRSTGAALPPYAASR